jgi:peroxiredoxin
MDFEVPRTDFYRIRLADNNFLVLILKPGDEVRLQAAASNLNLNIFIEGSAASKQIYQTGMMVNYYEQKLDSINKEYQKVASDPASEAAIVKMRDQYVTIEQEYKNMLRLGIQRDPVSLAWLFFIEKLDITNDFAIYALLDDSLFANYPYITYVQNLHNKIAKERRTAKGSIAPDIRLPNPAGDSLSLSSFRGKIVLIDFWAGWCGPCRRENPNLVRLYKQYKDKGFEIFGVSLDRTRDSWINAIQADSITWPQVSDLKYWQSEAAQVYGVGSIPHTVLIDREGRILDIKLRGQELELRLAKLLGN